MSEVPFLQKQTTYSTQDIWIVDVKHKTVYTTSPINGTWRVSKQISVKLNRAIIPVVL